MRGLRIRVRGQVQGVGFRPFVWQLAQRFDICGEVLNDPEGVLIHGCGAQIDAFVAAIASEAPPLARVDAVETRAHRFADAPARFEIAASRGAGAETRVTPDAATCADCLDDIRGQDPRRRSYAFTNCTHCGPRFTILRGLPYDRARTTMAGFEMCADCAREYADPADRRFHAQPVACAACGPRVWLEPSGGIAEAAQMLRDGKILAIKGLGGFHLSCDALNAEAVALLRARKRRPSKPLALMGTLEMIRRFAQLSEADAALLHDPAAPIVLVEAAKMSKGIAPGMSTLGWMLPYTPLHHLLLDAFQGPLVMTSGNLSGEPQVIGNDEAREKLAGFADGFLMHDRDIARRLDDSVERAEPPMVLRRARGRVPGTLPLPPGFDDAPQVVAYGGQMKSALCLVKNGQALLGHHLGELDEALTYDAFLQADADYAALFDHAPRVVAVDSHPDFRASRHGADRAGAEGLTLVEVQHHHAHLASCLAENGWPLDGGKVAGIILDGLGLGPDGTVWGGEVLLGDYHGYERRAWLDPAPLIGGDAANREPWRNLLARLTRGPFADETIGWLLADKPVDMLRNAVAKGINAPLSSSAGRLFDAVAALVFQDTSAQSFEGEFAMRLEAAALRAEADGAAVSFDQMAVTNGEIDTAVMMHDVAAAMVAGTTPGQIALAFHIWLAEAFAAPARALIDSGAAQAVALSGGCFQNALLLRLTLQALDGLPVLTHSVTPVNDGGLALGQAVIAAAWHLPGTVKR
ncbi:carbamoyltransferase HypF [Phaeobacter gallaeciensis]|uniref:carbamoyltransferase HypF n=1 Tax=Phaeobacter gallaeciensis TaxID=60890 RepID=UPI00237FA8E6|nr:carbamoyltransferase HypF [Phaeobacter gallaeciensis]MDE4100007.1 carbamoyltransferase HypF [Phaeobacter gallaeciensis]MDE4108801.1 carbamoyltransferase HypF [Phaeobacter gallaeciensis]MDE4113247.1 carbamoyltransferase HypF [Phaeobacter gallaeciensis]MDE4117688.1 carbamoyltransferase HypF [Phaeobacter gallaeciensis]MDE4122191.1 carbamoyltransferase HypF [Phaeobacter gallaeciensis]